MTRSNPATNPVKDQDHSTGAHGRQTNEEDTVTTATQTPAQERKNKAHEHLRTLEAERNRLQQRQHAAAETIERCNQEIVAAERAGDATACASLRKERQDQQDVTGDISRVFPTLDREIALAQGELVMACRACAADTYNEIVNKQRSLTETIAKAVETIIKALEVKEGLAKKQDHINVQDIGCRYPVQAADVRRILLLDITNRLQSVGTPVSFARRDWTCQRMTDQGVLLEVE